MKTTMRMAEAVPVLKAAVRKPFGILFKDNPKELQINKGGVGQLLETYVGLKNGNANMDFIDGELKSNKTKPSGAPDQTIAITNILSNIDRYLSDPPVKFAETDLCKKLDNLLIVPVVREGPCDSWYILEAYQIDIRNNLKLRNQLEKDYNHICKQIRYLISSGGNLKTTNGYYLQIRTKDSKPYSPIYTKEFERYISNKNYAFYFQTQFIKDIVRDAVIG